jgi:putative aldouronate transport system substrate-binding protein
MKRSWMLNVLISVVSIVFFLGISTNAFAGTLTDEPVTLTWFMPTNPSWSQQVTDLNEVLFFQEMERITGVHIEWMMPPVGQEAEQFSLMINSGDLPDLITHESNFSYPGGGGKAVADGAYLRLNEIIEKHAPNFSAILESNPNIANQCKTDEGIIWSFPMVEEVRQGAWLGMVVRQDWLDKLGIETPVTFDDWYNMLIRFRDEIGANAPMLMEATGVWSDEAFIAGFNVGKEFYNVDGKVMYGPIEEGYRDYITTMAKWYSEGLIDKEFNTHTGDDFSRMISTDETGAYREGFYMLEARKKTASNPDFRLVAVTTPVHNVGDVAHLRQSNNYMRGYETVITSTCQNPELAAKYLDFIYSDEGYMLSNYGVEGVTYILDENGEPQWTDLIVNNPDGKGINDAIHYYCLHHGPMNRVWDRDAPGYSNDENACAEIWGKADDLWVIPPITLTASEGSERATLMADIQSYANEMTVKFIMGLADLNEYDSFVNQIKMMNIDRAIELTQNALDRYNAR